MSEGTIFHFGSVRISVRGSGNLDMRLLGLSEVRTKTLVPFVMSASPDKDRARLANFTSQSAQLEIKTDAINETFVISKIVIYAKAVAANYPG